MRTIQLWSWVIFLAGCALAAPTPPPQRPATHPNIVLITIDTTRADRMGFLGSQRGLTPNLDALARQSLVFARAYAQVPLTTPSHAVILTGTYPQFNHVDYMGDPLARTLPFLPDILRRKGYRTAAFVGGLALDPKSVAPGFERGFEVYDAGFHRKRGNQDRYHSLERRAEDVVERALNWLRKRPAGPAFLWVHLYDPHDPYDPPEPFKTKYRAEPYDGEIAYTDSAVAKLVTGLRSQGLFDGALVAVMADHGEAFGEHGENHHGIFLYDETVQVPLLVKLPRQHTPTRVDARVGLVDVAPTILRAAELPVPAAMQGESLLRFIKAEGGRNNEAPAAPENPVYSASDYGHRSFGWSTLRAWRTGKYVYIEAPQRELYDQDADPTATHNLAAESGTLADTVSSQMLDFYRKTRGGDAEKTELSVEQSENLHALGYMSSDAKPSGEPDSGSGPDPKQKIGVANLLYEGLVDVENDQYAEAVPVLEQVLRQEPNTPMASLQLGRAYVALKQYDKALAPLQQLVQERPDNALARYELGCALVKTGHWEEAAPHFEAAVSQLNSSSMMHFYLALVYQRTRRTDDALQEFRNALKADSDNFAANLLLGRMLLDQQKSSEALPYLRKAAKLHPNSIDAHGFLGNAYMQLGQTATGRRELDEAERLQSEGGSRLGTPREDAPPP
jgi:arylsulfatase A-like enzyme/Tfp pilus assembly protein PilF